MTKDEARKAIRLARWSMNRGMPILDTLVTDPTAVLDKMVELGVLRHPATSTEYYFAPRTDLYEVVPKPPPPCSHEREHVVIATPMSNLTYVTLHCEDCGHERSVPNAWPKPKKA